MEPNLSASAGGDPARRGGHLLVHGFTLSLLLLVRSSHRARVAFVELPAGVATLKDELEKLGYRVVAEEGGAWPWAEFVLKHPTHPASHVRLGHDRRAWAVEVLVAGAWRSSYTALLALRGAAHQTRALSHDERRESTMAFLAVYDGSLDHVKAIEDREADLRAVWTRQVEGR